MARDEVSAFEEYDYIVVNDELEACVDRMRAIVMAERAKLECMRGEADKIIKDFLVAHLSLIALGVGGGIGAYKAVEVARGLQKNGHDVIAVMTRNARRFVGPLTFEAITRHKVLTDQFAPGANSDIEHISIASSIDLLLVAPATANVIGKFANGIADDFLSSLYLATKAPVLLAPAMNTNMLEHAAVQRNLDQLAAQGVRFVDPGAGYLACGWIGKGRLAEPPEIVAAAEQMLAPSGPLRGARVLVTAGPTREALDPVRFVGNRSSGKMGYALAAAARGRGADVVLISGPTALKPPAGVDMVHVTTAAEMHQAVMRQAGTADVVIMAAAVADYAPSGRRRAEDSQRSGLDDAHAGAHAGHHRRAGPAARRPGQALAGGLCRRDERRGQPGPQETSRRKAWI